MGSSVVMIVMVMVAQGAGLEGGRRRSRRRGRRREVQRRPAALAKRPLCRGRGSPDGDRSGGEKSPPPPRIRPSRSRWRWPRPTVRPVRVNTPRRSTASRRLPRPLPKNADLPARLADLYLTRGEWEAAEAAMRQAQKLDPDQLQARWVEGRLLRAAGRARKGRRGLEMVRRSLQRKTGRDRGQRRRVAPGRPGRRTLLPRQCPRRRAERLAQRRDQRHLRSRAAGRSQLLAGPLARRAAFPLGLQRAAAMRELARAQQINPLAPEVLVTLGQADLQGYRLAAGRCEGRAGPGGQSALRPGLRAAGRSQHLRRAIRRRQGRRARRPSPKTLAMKTRWRGWRPRAGFWSIPSGRPPPSSPPSPTTPGPRPSTPPWPSGSPTVASITPPNEPSCSPPPPTPPAPRPPSAWACSTCRSAAKPRPRASSTPPSTPTRSTSAPTT